MVGQVEFDALRLASHLVKSENAAEIIGRRVEECCLRCMLRDDIAKCAATSQMSLAARLQLCDLPSPRAQNLLDMRKRCMTFLHTVHKMIPELHEGTDIDDRQAAHVQPERIIKKDAAVFRLCGNSNLHMVCQRCQTLFDEIIHECLICKIHEIYKESQTLRRRFEIAMMKHLIDTRFFISIDTMRANPPMFFFRHIPRHAYLLLFL